MLNDEETAHVVTLLEDLEIDLRNGNVPAANLLVISIVNFLTTKHPLEWKVLGGFVNVNLEETESRLALLHLVPKVKELICPFQPDQEAGS